MAEEQDQDIILVNSSGRVVAVPNDLGQELLQQSGFKRASDAQIKELRKWERSNSPEVLARKEAERVKQAKADADKFFQDEENETGVNTNPTTETAQQTDASHHPINEGNTEADKPKSRQSK